jgi:hypothetical protein
MSDKRATIPEQNKESYLGDGVYISFDGWQIILRAPRETADHYIALEPQVYAALRQWINQYELLKKHMEQQ